MKGKHKRSTSASVSSSESQSQLGARVAREHLGQYEGTVKVGTPVVAGGIAENALRAEAALANLEAKERRKRRLARARHAGVKAQIERLKEVR